MSSSSARQADQGALRVQNEEGAALAVAVHRATARLHETLMPVEGALVEPKRFVVAAHYRQAARGDVPTVESAVDRALDDIPELRKTYGKQLFELRPCLDRDKGKAVVCVLEALGLHGPDVLPFYLGDDKTDEDAFAMLAERGVTVLV